MNCVDGLTMLRQASFPVQPVVTWWLSDSTTALTRRGDANRITHGIVQRPLSLSGSHCLLPLWEE